MAYLWNPTPTPIFTASGSFASGAAAYFYVGSSTTPLVVYLDSALTAPAPWPVVASIVGVFPPIYVPYGNYGVRIVSAQGAQIYYAGNIDNPAPPSGGGGVVVTANQIFQTGYTTWLMRTGALSGFVRMNGNTLGSTASGATEYAAADASSLFTALWVYLPNAIAAVSGGRGVSAPADFAANKTIVIPTMQGILAAGVDDMGTTAGGFIQAITTCSPTGASNIVPVASAAFISVGQSVIINSVAIGTVTAINGLNVTCSAIPLAGIGVSWRSSIFSDAQQVGAEAGVPNKAVTVDQMPTHNHAITDPGHLHTVGVSNSGGGTNFAGAVAVVAGSINTGSQTTGITINNSGGGNPFGIVQPTRLGTWYMKL
jgi:hypothetical protein